MMKRICIYGCSEMLGGTEKYILTLYKALNKEEIQFDFLYPYNTYPFKRLSWLVAIRVIWIFSKS